MAKSKTVKTTQTKKTPSTTAKPKTAVQEALEVTWVLKGHLKNAQLSYLRIGKLLTQVRDEKLYAELKHPDMESYAEERLNLGRTSLYRYLRVYDWVLQAHKEWLEPHPKGFIPDLSDAGDLMWIEHELTRKDLAPKARTELEALRAKALEGRLRQSELDQWHRGSQPGTKSLKSVLSTVRAVRRRGGALTNMPAEAIAHLDAAIDIIQRALAGKPSE